MFDKVFPLAVLIASEVMVMTRDNKVTVTEITNTLRTVLTMADRLQLIKMGSVNTDAAITALLALLKALGIRVR